jgi:soluble lytic murein transglycosylase-like protein
MRFWRRGDVPRPPRRRRRHVPLFLAGAAALFVPHAGKAPARTRHAAAPAPRSANDPARPRVILATLNEDYKPRPEAYNSLIEEAAETHGLDAAILRAVIEIESAFDPLAVSPAGAQGLMQLMPALAEELGVTDAFDARQNIMAGARYLAYLLHHHGGDLSLALASYNAGPGAVAFYGGVPPFEETETYIRRVAERLERP